MAAGRLFVPSGSPSIAVYGLKWLMNDPRIGHAIGQRRPDGWSAGTNQDPVGYLQWGPLPTVLAPGPHRAGWDLLIDNNTATGDTGPIVELTVFDYDKNTALARRTFTAPSGPAPTSTRISCAPFTLPAGDAGDRLGFRVFWYQRAYVRERDVHGTMTP